MTSVPEDVRRQLKVNESQLFDRLRREIDDEKWRRRMIRGYVNIDEQGKIRGWYKPNYSLPNKEATASEIICSKIK